MANAEEGQRDLTKVSSMSLTHEVISVEIEGRGDALLSSPGHSVVLPTTDLSSFQF